MIDHPVLSRLLDGHHIHQLKKSHKMTRIVLKAESRVECSDTIAGKLDVLNIKYIRKRMPGSSFPSIAFDVEELDKHV